jgi:O-antigen ligase
MKNNKIVLMNKIICLLIILFISSYFGIFAGTKGMFYLSIILSAVMIVALLLGFLKKQTMPFFSTWIALFLFLAVSSLFHLSQSFSYLILFALGGLILLTNFKSEDVSFSFKVLCFICIVLSASIIWQAFHTDSFYLFAKKWFYHSTQYENVYHQGVWSREYSGIFCEVSYAAFFLCLGCAYTASNIYFKKRRVLNIVLFLIFYFSIILTGKRSFVLIIPATLFLLFLMSLFKKPTSGKLLVIISLVFFSVFAVPFLFDKVVSILTKGTGEIQLSSRESIWNLALSSFFNNPLFGSGINTFDSIFNSSGIRDSYYSFAGAHNSYLQILSEIGIVGFLLYFGFLLFAVTDVCKKIYKSNNVNIESKRYLVSILISLLFILLYGFSGNPLHQPQQLITIFMLVSFSTNLSKYSFEKKVNLYENCLYTQKRA